LTFSIAKPFRKPIWKNPLFFVSVYLMLAYQTFLLFHCDETSKSLFALMDLPHDVKLWLIITFAVNSALTYLYEKAFITWFTKFYNNYQSKKK